MTFRSGLGAAGLGEVRREYGLQIRRAVSLSSAGFVHSLDLRLDCWYPRALYGSDIGIGRERLRYQSI